MKNIFNKSIIYAFVLLAFSVMVLIVNYMSINTINQSLIKTFSVNNLSTSEEYITMTKKEDLVEQAKFWGIPQEVIKRIN